LSCNQGYKVIVENLILAGANIHEQNNAGMTPLYHATIPVMNQEVVKT
jgi:ankyrin repeat protein